MKGSLFSKGLPSPSGVSRNWHTFGAGGALFLLDVASGSLHIIDEMAMGVIKALKRGDDPKSVSKEAGEVLIELDELFREGLVSDPDDPDVVPSAIGGRHIKALCIHASHDCDMRCGYCFAGAGRFGGRQDYMSPDMAVAAMEFLFRESGPIRHLEVDFFGGEPLMNLSAVKAAVEHGRMLERQQDKTLKFTLTTNSLSLGPEVDRYLNDNDFAVVLSIDGRPEIHDAARRRADGGSTFETCLGNAKRFVESRPGGEYYVRGTYTRNNLDFTKDVEYLVDHGFEHISLEPVVAFGESPYALREQDLDHVFGEYERLLDYLRSLRAAGRHVSFFHFDLNIAKGPCLAKRLSGCGAGADYVAITPDGAIYPCHQFVGRPELEMGHVSQGIVREDIRDRFREAHIYSKPECSECWARFYCSGGCHANAYSENACILTPYSIGCAITKKRLECALAYAAT